MVREAVETTSTRGLDMKDTWMASGNYIEDVMVFDTDGLASHWFPPMTPLSRIVAWVEAQEKKETASE